MSESTITIPSLGPVTFVRSARAKYQRITVRSDKTVVVTIPRRGNLTEAREFLKAKISWIQKQLQKIDQHTQYREREQETPDLDIDFIKAQEELFGRLEYFSEKYKMSFNKAAFRCQRTRWGSCSYKNNISLNINIAFLPEQLQNYVLLHELVHTKVKNHSKAFWKELDKYTQGKAKELAKELRKYHINLIE